MTNGGSGKWCDYHINERLMQAFVKAQLGLPLPTLAGVSAGISNHEVARTSVQGTKSPKVTDISIAARMRAMNCRRRISIPPRLAV